MNDVIYQSPDVSHAPQISRMVRESAELDNNSEYIYALWCTYFSPHSAVALRDGEVIAFVTGFRCPTAPDTYFLWQTATKPRHGVPNLGVDLILYAAEREIETGARAIAASVDAKNKPIKMLMKSLCKRLGGRIETDILFPSDILSTGDADHHDEVLYTIDLNAGIDHVAPRHSRAS